MIVLGIDPGLSGAVAYLDRGLLALHDMPVTERKVNGKLKRQIDPYALADLIRRQGHVDLVVVEQVGAMPGQGVTSSFNFGFTAGCIQGVVAASGLSLRTVSPQVWKRHYGLLGQGKDASRAEASRRLPAHAPCWYLKKHDGRAEAALLALYGREVQ